MFACGKFQRECVAIVFDMLSCWMFCDMSLLLCLCVMSCKGKYQLDLHTCGNICYIYNPVVSFQGRDGGLKQPF